MNDPAAAPLPTLNNGTRPDGVEYKTRGLEMRMESGHYGEHKQHPTTATTAATTLDTLAIRIRRRRANRRLTSPASLSPLF